jgi:hypothetical protein
MQTPFHGSYHDQARCSQSIHQMIGTDAGEEHIGLALPVQPSRQDSTALLTDLHFVVSGS